MRPRYPLRVRLKIIKVVDALLLGRLPERVQQKPIRGGADAKGERQRSQVEMKLRSLVLISRIKILDHQFQARTAFAHRAFVGLGHVRKMARGQKLVAFVNAAFAGIVQLVGEPLGELDRQGLAL